MAFQGSAGNRKDSEDVDTSPLLQVNNLKQQRTSDEQRLRVLRWDFSTPRAEFITQLKDQMTNAGMNRQLVSNMFHQDFKFHIKAIDALNEVSGQGGYVKKNERLFFKAFVSF